MKVIIFGASRGTGFQVMKQALTADYEVTAIVRNPTALTIRHNKLKIIKGDVLQRSTFEKEVTENTTVISTLGAKNEAGMTVYSNGLTNIIKIMETAGARRLLCLSALGVEVTPGMPFIMKVITKQVLQKLLKYNFTDLLRMESIVKQSKLDWTIVRPPRLSNRTPSGKYRLSFGGYVDNPGS
ncbi:MAG: NAD(P)H-binding protein, partial [Bacteroidota bacterium]|nr:NAD(P)H-binding protein [Bacteroidota bacterium]